MHGRSPTQAWAIPGVTEINQVSKPLRAGKVDSKLAVPVNCYLMMITDYTIGYLDNLTLEDPGKEAYGLRIWIKSLRIQRLQWLEMLFYADKKWQEISLSRMHNRWKAGQKRHSWFSHGTVHEKLTIKIPLIPNPNPDTAVGCFPAIT